MSNTLADRIKTIQKNFKVDQSGVFDLNTCIAFEKLIDMKPVLGTDVLVHRKGIQKAIGLKGSDLDGIFGPVTITKIENYLSTKLPDLPLGASLIVSKNGLDQILNFEISSESNYTKNLSSPSWPGGESGITIGIGYDLGFCTVDKLKKDWSMLTDTKLKVLSTATGKKGIDAKKTLGKSIKSIIISLEDAKEVFYTVSLEEYAMKVRNIYPGVQELPGDAQTALLSLVYNRGENLKGDSRKEMANIVQLVKDKNLPGIAGELRSMKRMWKDKGLPGLLKRREQEAVMAENASYFIAIEDYIFV